jgi:ABC-type transport system substrate-binding protein
MGVRRFLIIAPAAVSLFLLLSYFWVPTYEEQTRGNPDRLSQFITAETGDATILIPVLSADNTSSQIEGMVFEGLIDLDADLQYRGRLAKSWKIYEHAYFYVNPQAATARWGRLDAPSLANKLRQALDANDPQWRHVTAVVLLPAESSTRNLPVKDAAGERQVTFRIQAPPRIRIDLDQVDQLLFDRLAAILGEGYFDTFDPGAHVAADPQLPPQELAAHAAELLPATAHNPVIEFHLRPGVRFHDGHPVTADDVKFTYEAIMDPRNLSPRVPDYEPVKEVQIVDPLTVRIVYKRLYSPAFGTWAMGILPAHLLDASALAKEAATAGKDPAEFTMRQSRFTRHPVGCGPFVFQEWKSDRYIALRRFEDYWEGPANYGTFTMRIIPDPLTQEMEFYAGTIDNYEVLPHQVARLSRDERFQHFSGTSLRYTYIGYNLRHPPFDDVRVRRALGMAIDTQKIIDFVLYDQGERITGPFAKQTDYYDPTVAPLPYDPQGAIRLLAEAGYTPGKDGYLQKNGNRLAFTLITNNGNPKRKAILAIAQDAWKKIGIQVETDLLEWSVFIQKRVNLLDFDAVVLGWSLTIDPDLYQIWHSSQCGKFQLNFLGFSDPEADDLIIKIRQEYDHQRQVAYCHRLHTIIARSQPCTFLYGPRWTALLDKRIVRRVRTPEGNIEYKPIVPTKTGSYSYDFNQWIKLSRPPVFTEK